MEEIFIPVLSHFENENPWTASRGRMRCRVVPTAAGESAQSVLTAQVWEGPWAYEYSTVEETKVFPLTEAGRAGLAAWLEQWAQAMNARPRQSLAEDIARRQEPEASH